MVELRWWRWEVTLDFWITKGYFFIKYLVIQIKQNCRYYWTDSMEHTTKIIQTHQHYNKITLQKLRDFIVTNMLQHLLFNRTKTKWIWILPKSIKIKFSKQLFLIKKSCEFSYSTKSNLLVLCDIKFIHKHFFCRFELLDSTSIDAYVCCLCFVFLNCKLYVALFRVHRRIVSMTAKQVYFGRH